MSQAVSVYGPDFPPWEISALTMTTFTDDYILRVVKAGSLYASLAFLELTE